jgi:chromosome segregation ATPase
MIIRHRALAAVFILALTQECAYAQTERTGGSANTQMLMQMQQLANEKAALQADVSKLKGELEKASKERDSLKESQQAIALRGRGVEAELAKAVSDRARLEGEVAQEKSRVQELVTRLRETAVSLRDVETQSETARGKLATREEELATCVERNQKLIALNDEVLRRFEDQGFWTSVGKKEPFTRLKRVELENLADGYRDTARDNRVEPPKP